MSDDMDADVMPEPCRDCMTPIPPGWGWCADCEARNKALDQAHKACPDCNVEPDEDGWLPYGHDPECKFDTSDVTSINGEEDVR